MLSGSASCCTRRRKHIIGSWRITDGDDDDRASWYAHWLTDLSGLPDLVGGKLVRSELTYMLVRPGKEYADRQPDERWRTTTPAS